MNIIAELKTDDGKSLGVMTVAPKNFKTGSRGYYANGKMELDGRRYQLQIQLVEIGSKGTPEPKPESSAESRPESNAASRPASNPDSKPALKPGSDPEPKPALKPGSGAEPKPSPKA